MSYTTATVVITTKNRRDELRKAITSTLAQTAKLELLVFDDGSTDGTADMVRKEFPDARVERGETSLGIIGARNHAVGLATHEIVFTIDDDCVFPSRLTVEQTLQDFDHPRIGAVAIPSMDVLRSTKVNSRAPKSEGHYLGSEFLGGVHAIRKTLFIALGRYRGYFYRQVEEGEFCMRMLDAGYVVRLGRADLVEHYESPVRHSPTIFFYQARNHILWAWYDVPMPHLPVHLAATTFNTLRDGTRKGYKLASLRGVLAGYGGIIHELGQRKPVSIQAYRFFRRMRASGPFQLDDIEPKLPAMKFV